MLNFKIKNNKSKAFDVKSNNIQSFEVKTKDVKKFNFKTYIPMYEEITKPVRIIYDYIDNKLNISVIINNSLDFIKSKVGYKNKADASYGKSIEIPDKYVSDINANVLSGLVSDISDKVTHFGTVMETMAYGIIFENETYTMDAMINASIEVTLNEKCEYKYATNVSISEGISQIMNVEYVYNSNMDVELSRKGLLSDNEEYLRELPVDLYTLGERIIVN